MMNTITIIMIMPMTTRTTICARPTGMCWPMR
jgi:hypothetical protein